MDPKRSISEKDIEGLLVFEKAAQLVISEDEHQHANSIEKLLRLIESHKTLQEKQMEGSFSKMEEAITAKKQLFEEISDFETKQRTALNITTTVIILLFVVFCFSCMWYKKKKGTENPKENSEQKTQKNNRWIVNGTEEEQRLKIEKMAKLEDTLERMDEELVKMRKELEEIKKK